MIKVGYVPYSKNLQHPGDRRRLAAWSMDKGVELNVLNPLDSDVLVLSNAANFGYWIKRAKQPVILDLVDGYLGEHPSLMRDIGRNILRSIKRTSDLKWFRYTNHLKDACLKSDAVIVASIEQKEIISHFNKNVHVILDDHSELDPIEGGEDAADNIVPGINSRNYLFWEGFGYTLKHFQLIAHDLDEFLSQSGWGMYLLTTEEFPRWGGYIGSVKTRSLIEDWFPRSNLSIEIIPWSIENVTKYAQKSSLAIIPIDSSDRFAALKSENKLLSMWHLGLPTLFSPIPSYSRVASEAQQEQASVLNGHWLASLLRFSASSSERSELNESSKIYIASHHTHQLLMKKWEVVLTSLTRSNRI